MNSNRILIPLLLSVCAFSHANSLQTLDSGAYTNSNNVINRKIINGAHTFDYRIIGGKPVEIESRPWMVALVSRGSPATAAFCGASLIAPRWVLTAAHCVSGADAASLDIVAGVAELNNVNAERISVSKIVVHPGYNNSSLDNDIALLKLESASRQKTVGYRVDDNTDAVGSKVAVSGWGNQSITGQQFPTKLHTADLLITDFDSCNRAYGGRLSSKHLCASNPGGTRDSCQGDSGGPLVTRVQSKDVQLGIVSFGLGCASKTHPGVYTRVSQFEGFIDKTIGGTAVAEIWVEQEFDRVLVGDIGYAWFVVFKGTYGDDVVVSNLQFKPSKDITIAGNACDNTKLGQNESCFVELAWVPTAQGDLQIDVSIDVFNGVRTVALNTTITGKALERSDRDSSTEQRETDIFTDNILD